LVDICWQVISQHREGISIHSQCLRYPLHHAPRGSSFSGFQPRHIPFRYFQQAGEVGKRIPSSQSLCAEVLAKCRSNNRRCSKLPCIGVFHVQKVSKVYQFSQPFSFLFGNCSAA
jgi:hypothetical protein